MDALQYGIQQGYPGVTGAFAGQFSPAVNLTGVPLAGVVGSGISGLFGPQAIGRHLGEAVSGIGVPLVPFIADPTTTALLQQAQLAQQAQYIPQGLFGNLLASVGQPFGSVVGSPIGGVAAPLARLSPLSVDPLTAAYVQQAQLAQYLVAQQLAQQAQLALQVALTLAHVSPFGNLLGPLGQPIPYVVPGLWSNPLIAGQIGGLASQLGRIPPFPAGILGVAAGPWQGLPAYC